MFSGNIIDELVRSVEMVEERVYTAPVFSVRRDNSSVPMRTLTHYEVPYREQTTEVA